MEAFRNDEEDGYLSPELQKKKPKKKRSRKQKEEEEDEEESELPELPPKKTPTHFDENMQKSASQSQKLYVLRHSFFEPELECDQIPMHLKGKTGFFLVCTCGKTIQCPPAVADMVATEQAKAYLTNAPFRKYAIQATDRIRETWEDKKAHEANFGNTNRQVYHKTAFTPSSRGGRGGGGRGRGGQVGFRQAGGGASGVECFQCGGNHYKTQCPDLVTGPF